MTDLYQATIYELAAPLGPHWSAILAGFAVVIFSTLYITPAGVRYLERYHND